MGELVEIFRALDGAGDATRLAREHALVERMTFATADELLAFVEEVSQADFLAMPVWLRNLAYRLAVLQDFDNPVVLKKAAGDLLCFGPDWDEYANSLLERAATLELHGTPPTP